jgi:nucleotide-binding universal stress UspA family protein
MQGVAKWQRAFLKNTAQEMPIRTEILAAGINNSIAENIIKFSNKENIDLIVIGNIGLGGISKVMALGSVSRKVCEMSSCPFLIVHQKVKLIYKYIHVAGVPVVGLVYLHDCWI